MCACLQVTHPVVVSATFWRRRAAGPLLTTPHNVGIDVFVAVLSVVVATADKSSVVVARSSAALLLLARARATDKALQFKASLNDSDVVNTESSTVAVFYLSLL